MVPMYENINTNISKWAWDMGTSWGCSFEVLTQITPPRHIFQQKPTMNLKNPN
jgi:hypothetical protein